MADAKLTLHDAAARPTQDAPLSEVEARLRRRRRLRRGTAGLLAVAVIAGIGGGVAISGDEGPEIRTVQSAAGPSGYGAEPVGLAVDLPPGWVVTPTTNVADAEAVLLVGTSMMSPDAPIMRCGPVQDATGPSSDSFIQIEASGLFDVLLPPQPSDFRSFPAIEAHGCTTGDGEPSVLTASSREYVFGAGRLAVRVVLTIGEDASEDEAFDVLNSLVVTPRELPVPIPVTAVPPSTVPESAETEAITAAFLGWIDTRPIDASGVYIEDFASIREAVIGAAAANGHPDDYTGRVEAITRIGENDADVIYSFIIDGQVVVGNLRGHAVKIDGVWLVSRDTVCEALLHGPVHCPPGE